MQSISKSWRTIQPTHLFLLSYDSLVGYPKKLLPDAGSQLVKGCESMKILFSDVKSRLHEFGVEYEVCPVGAHYMHGKVEREIRHAKDCFGKHFHGERLSVIQWESLSAQVANTMNNLPIGLGNLSKDLENLDLITPNRLMLARNNDRSPIGPVKVSSDLGKIIERNNDIFAVWFKAWLISCVPSLMFQPKWFRSDRDIRMGDIVLFLKSEKDFEEVYQYGIVKRVHKGRDNLVRKVDVEYQNSNEATKRKADTPADEETVEKIAKLKEAAAEVVTEAEKSLPSEPLTEAEATA